MIHVLSYLLPMLRVWISPSQNLKAKYQTKWAMVTGGSSGIGKSIVIELAKQELNVVVVALEDDLLSSTMTELSQRFPALKFRSVGASFSPGVDYMGKIMDATKDIDIGIVFNNAGYMATGFFYHSTIDRQLANLECNATSAIKITHHFMDKMLKSGKKGCFVFTSSAAAFLPSPFACMYGGTKAFLSQFAASLATEAHPHGIDVLVVHPSPVETRFYDKCHQLDALDFAKSFAVTPDALPLEIFNSIGRVVSRDIGGMSVGGRLALNIVNFGSLMLIMSRCAKYLPDFKRHSKKMH